LVQKAVLARASAFDLDEIGRRKDRPEKANVEQIGTVVAGGHHADRDANASLAGLVGRDEVARAKQVVVGKVDGELLRVGHRTGDLHRKVGLVLAGKQAVGHNVEDLRQLSRVVLADREDDGLADFATDRITQRVLQKRLAQNQIGGLREKALLELALLESFLLVLAGVVRERDDESFFGKQLRGDIGTCVYHRGIDEVFVLDSIQQ